MFIPKLVSLKKSFMTLMICGTVVLLSNHPSLYDNSVSQRWVDMQRKIRSTGFQDLSELYELVDSLYIGTFNMSNEVHDMDPGDMEAGEGNSVYNHSGVWPLELPGRDKGYHAYQVLPLSRFLKEDTDFTKKPLLVLFSSWIDNPEKRHVNDIKLKLWNAWPEVRPLVLTNDRIAVSQANAHNWTVLPQSESDPSCKGPPKLPQMFQAVMKNVDAFFYGFSNADILFDNGLYKTMEYIYYNMRSWQTRPVMVIGRRHNVDFLHNSNYSLETPDDINHFSKYGWIVNKSTDFYFTNRLFPWDHAPEVTVGKIFVVRAILGWAYRNNYIVIDATRTIRSVHLTTQDGNKASFSTKGAFCNKQVLSKHRWSIPTHIGHVECAHFETFHAQDQEHTIKIRHRPGRALWCN